MEGLEASEKINVGESGRVNEEMDTRSLQNQWAHHPRSHQNQRAICEAALQPFFVRKEETAGGRRWARVIWRERFEMRGESRG